MWRGPLEQRGHPGAGEERAETSGPARSIRFSRGAASWPVRGRWAPASATATREERGRWREVCGHVRARRQACQGNG